MPAVRSDTELLKYRAAVVLCYLEGLTHEMAAEHLGWPVGSVKSRLAWARERLRMRLSRRGVAPASHPFDRSGSLQDVESASTPVMLGTHLVDASLRGALKTGMGTGALAGIVSAEPIALMEGIIKTMTNAKVIRVMAAVLIAGLTAAGAGVLGYCATRQERPLPPSIPGQKARRPAAAALVAQDPARPAGTKPAADQGPLMIRAEVVDPEGLCLPGADVTVTVWYARAAGTNESVLERTASNGDGRVDVKVARERPGARVTYAAVWAYQAGRAIATSNVLLTGKSRTYLESWCPCRSA